MKKTWMLAAAVALMLGGAAFGASAPAAAKPGKGWLRTWFQHLKQGLTESAVQADYQRVRVTAVAAVRGTPQDSADQNKPSWKAGAKARKTAQAKTERQEFGKAVDLILEGKTGQGIAALEAFEKAHPKSALLADVAEAKERARQLEAEGQSPEAAPPATGRDAKAGGAVPEGQAEPR
ncbi:MAG: hypothetical protein HY924_03435 [Elusimicrobia bacterium]|nr:hypothetical protein [Elusimicrobiota bacterium]